MTTEEETSSVLFNFRPVAGFNSRVYRCGKPDGLAQLIGKNKELLTSEERLFLYDITLNVDLRSPRESNPQVVQKWTSGAPGGAFEIVPLHNHDEKDTIKSEDDLVALLVTNDKSKKQRILLQGDLLHSASTWFRKHWLNEEEQPLGEESVGGFMKRVFVQVEKRGLGEFLFDTVESNKKEMAVILKAITMELEQVNKNGKPTSCVINCTQGKDRTGMLSLLMQSAIGLPREDIVADFVLSDKVEQSKQGSAAMKALFGDKGNHKALGGAKTQTMDTVTDLFTDRYGSVSPGFLDEIGFDESWRNRLKATVNDN